MIRRANKRLLDIILGIDPGSRVTGYGVIQTDGRQIIYLDSGCIRVANSANDLPMSSRLKMIYDGVQEIIRRYQPVQFAIEQVFLARNADSALKLGQARGVAIVAAANHQLPVYEYSARQVKQAVVGTGAAAKSQVQLMVKTLLKLSRSPQADAADALGIAICHAHLYQSMLRLAGSSVASGMGADLVAPGKVRRGRVRT